MVCCPPDQYISSNNYPIAWLNGQDLLGRVNTDNWENVRIPRPWESEITHEEAIEKMMEIREKQQRTLYNKQQKVIDEYFERSLRAQREQAKKIDELPVPE